MFDENSGQTPPSTPNERRTHPDIHEREVITDPRRLAEIVFNTVDLTFEFGHLQIDEEKVREWIKNPAENWDRLVGLMAPAYVNAASATEEIAAMDRTLRLLVDNPGEGLPVSLAGDPPRTIVDRRGIQELLAQKRKENDALEDKKMKERAKWTDEQIAAQSKIDAEQVRTKEASVATDPVRSLARMIIRIQEDGIKPLISLFTGYAEYIVEPDKHKIEPGYNPETAPFMGLATSGLLRAERYVQAERTALHTFSQGNLPTEAEITEASQGSKAVAAYLDKFAPPQPPTSRP